MAKRDETLEQMASRLLLDVFKGNRRESGELDNVVDRTVKELGLITVAHPTRWPTGTGIKLRPMVIAELNRLFRRGRISLHTGDSTWLCVVVHPEGLRLVADNTERS